MRAVILDDSLGIAADLDAATAAHVDGYRDEWRDVLEDPVKLARFAGFVNAADAVDERLQYVVERGQPRPATDADRESGVELVDSERRPVIVAGPILRRGGTR